MATTAKFDRSEAIQKATNLFWEKGFHATSMRNLQDAIDMRPGSIYASFGSKEGLFKEALQCYSDSALAFLESCVAETSSPLEALKTFIKFNVVGSRKSSPSNLCMLVKTISELTEDNAELLAESKRLLAISEKAFAVLLSKAKDHGEIDASSDPKRLARFLQMQMMGLRAYARASDSDARVNELIDDVFAQLH